MINVNFFSKLPKYARVLFYSLIFEEVLSFKAQLTAINWQVSLVKYVKLGQVSLSRVT